jgi:hypothetical protein
LRVFVKEIDMACSKKMPYPGGAASRRHGVLRTEAEALWRLELAS